MVVITCNDNGFGNGKLTKHIIKVLQILKAWGAVEKVSRNKKQVHLTLLAHLKKAGESICYFVGTKGAPRLVLVWHHAKMYVCRMDKFHVLPH